MSQYIVIKRIKVQNANTIAGFTWGFPAITNFLGFVQNLSRKLADITDYQDITLNGCAVFAHEHQAHIFGRYERRFIQSRNPPYLKNDVDKVVKGGAPSVIEEGKMNMTVSLLVGCNGNIGNREENFLSWLKNVCFLQRMAGGTILDIGSVQLHRPGNAWDVKNITRKLLPGYVLLDRSTYLESHYQNLIKNDPDEELLDAWLDFSMLKQKARPKSDLVSDYLHKLVKNEPNIPEWAELLEIWLQHIGKPYDEENIPMELKTYFEQLENNKANKKLVTQWKSYCEPNEKTDADWEYVPKPNAGYLVPIMTGYKAISKVYKNADVGNTRDSKTDVCFVESVHSVGEWQSVHRIKTPEQLQNCLWHYHHEENWYLCRQMPENETGHQVEASENIEDEIYS